jgi:hypothetical protein
LRHYPTRKRADFPRVLTGVNRLQTGVGGDAELSRGRNDPCWCGLRHRRHIGSRHGRSNAQVAPKANGTTASWKGCRRPAEPRRIVSRRDVDQCLSCMHRKGARAVLRGGGEPDLTSLPDVRHEGVAETVLLLKEVTTPAVLPAVCYRGVRPWQRGGTKPSGQRNLILRDGGPGVSRSRDCQHRGGWEPAVRGTVNPGEPLQASSQRPSQRC